MAVQTVSVHILGKDYQVACPDEERNDLMRAASELDKRMREIRQSGNVIGVERIAIMAALNLAYELHKSELTPSTEQEKRLRELHQRLDKALSS